MHAKFNIYNIYSWIGKENSFSAVISVLGSVTNYGTKMKYVHCSPIQHMVVKKADYGDFSKNGAFNDDKNVDAHCSALTNCQVKSLCGGNTSCELAVDNNLLPSTYCSDTSKQIYIQYTCTDSGSSTIITGRYLTNRFHFAVRVQCNRSRTTS